MRELEKQINELDSIIRQYMAPMTEELPTANTIYKDKDYGEDCINDPIKPLHQKDMKAPPEYSGTKKEFLSWHGSFSSMLACKTIEL